MRPGTVHAFVHGQDLSEAGLRELLPLSSPGGGGTASVPELAVAYSATVAIFAGPLTRSTLTSAGAR